MKRVSVVRVLLGAAWALSAVPVAAATIGSEVDETLRWQPRARVMIELREPVGLGGEIGPRIAAVKELQDRVLSELDDGDFLLTHAFGAVSALAGELSRSGLSKLMMNPDVVRVDLDVPVFAAMTESVPLIRGDQAHNRGATGRGVTVAALDTGVDSAHPDYRDRLVAEQCFCANADGSGCCPNGATQQSGTGAARDDNGHGTNVAGVMVSAGRAGPAGMAPDAALVAVRILDQGGVAASTAQIVSALDWILTSRPDVQVVNLSVATGNLFATQCDSAASFTAAFAQAISALRARGTITFASTGNNGNPTQIAAPACVSSAVSVGAVYDDNVGSVSFGCVDATTAADRVTCFSNGGSIVDLLAPGGAITASGVGGGASTYYGTSQASPHAAGAAALLFSFKGGLTPDQVEQALKASGVPIADSRNGLTVPRINVDAALSALP